MSGCCRPFAGPDGDGVSDGLSELIDLVVQLSKKGDNGTKRAVEESPNGMMIEHPIMFGGPSVRALLSGRKTQTRLLANKHRKARLQRAEAPDAIRLTPSVWRDTNIGDRFWVRESLGWDKSTGRLFYRADGATVLGAPPPGQAIGASQLSSLYMPRWASRLVLTVSGVRIEHLQAISEDEAIAEGIIRLDDGRFAADDSEGDCYPSAALGYARRWSDFHGRPGTRWEDDPEVVVVDFQVERCDMASDRARSSG
jgi:hypothetical protein